MPLALAAHPSGFISLILDLDVAYKHYFNSHTNPWFGVSIVPFNTTLNWGKVPNVEFDLEEEDDNPDYNNNSETLCQRIVGRASCNIKKGQELFQAYGTSVADFVYRYGFAPSKLEDSDSMDGDVVSIDMSDILSIAQETKYKKGKTQCSLNSETLNVKTRRQVGSEESDNRFASTTNIPQLASRLDALKLSGALDESPWDGLDGHWTAEIARPTQPFLQSLRVSSQAKNHPKRGRENGTSPMNTEDKVAYDDGGLSKLVGTFLCSWQTRPLGNVLPLRCNTLIMITKRAEVMVAAKPKMVKRARLVMNQGKTISLLQSFYLQFLTCLLNRQRHCSGGFSCGCWRKMMNCPTASSYSDLGRRSSSTPLSMCILILRRLHLQR